MLVVKWKGVKWKGGVQGVTVAVVKSVSKKRMGDQYWRSWSRAPRCGASGGA